MGAIEIALSTVFGLMLFGSWLLIFQLMKQQGRLVLRLDAIEDYVGLGASAPPSGLDVGTPIEPFTLPDVDGKTVSLEDFHGKRVLLVNWSPRCGFCARIASALAAAEADLARHNTQLLLAADADADANRALAEEHGLECPILLQGDSETLAFFGGLGTPVAYLLDEERRVAAPLAIGADAVPALAREAAGEPDRNRLSSERPLNESRIEREGLRAGTQAPVFRLPDLNGGQVALEEYRGRKVLLAFSDPSCGPCEELAPELARLHQRFRDDGLAVLMVARGDPEANRRKARQYRFEFAVGLQNGWRVSKQYGIFETPVAFLLDEEGRIARDVARGVDEIRALVGDAAASNDSEE